MDIVKDCRQRVLDGEALSRKDALALLDTDLEQLCTAADEVRRMLCGDGFDICTIINGKSGRCSEDCRYCAQSAHYPGTAEEYPLLGGDEIVEAASRNADKGVLRFSVVTSGRCLTDEEVDQVCARYREIGNACGIALCASHGLLTYPQFIRLREAGVVRYHNNLETSRRYFPSICTTHTYDDKLNAIRDAQKAGLAVCSGGIMGLGETMEDRIDMALDLRDLGVQSIPINILNPIPGTPLENQARLSLEEVRRTAAVYRFLLPRAVLRLAGGRGLLPDKGKSVFRSGANAAISGDMLTTSGIRIEQDMEMLKELGFVPRLL